MNGREFHDGRSKLYYERSRFLWWQPDVLLWTVKLFMMTDREFCDNWSKCYYERSRFSRWWVEIFMMAAWDFYDMLRFSWKQVKIFNDSAKSRRVRGASHQPALMGYFEICSHTSWSIHPGNGIIFCFRWCTVQEGCWCGFNRFIVKKSISKEWPKGPAMGFYTEKWQSGRMQRPKAYFLCGWSFFCIPKKIWD